jgi:cob(I)alamin adenosyltransferase
VSRIATGTGDKGQTGLFDGSRVAKSHALIRAFGDIDELDAVLGVAAEAAERAETKRAIEQLQHEIFMVKSDLATPLGAGKQVRRVGEADVKSLDARIDALEAALPELKAFIMNGGSACAANLQLARTVARRAERSAWEAHESGTPLNDHVLVWLNRASDYLFLLARQANRDAGVSEEHVKMT